jgi:outer membrane protein
MIRRSIRQAFSNYQVLTVGSISKVTAVNKLTLYSLASALGVCASASASAQHMGDVMASFGWAHFSPQGSSGPFKITALGNTTTATGSGSTANAADTIGLTLTYFVTDHVAVEGSFGIPERYHITGTGTLEPLGELGSVRSWSPMLLLKYYLTGADNRWRPFVAGGASYVWFNGLSLSPAASSGAFLHSNIYGSALEGPTTAKIDSTFAPIATVGVSLNFSEHWSAGVSFSYMWLTARTTLTTQSSVGEVKTESKSRVNPLIGFFSLGYRF